MTNFCPLKINVTGIEKIQTPFGYLPTDWVEANLNTMGIKKGEYNWVIISEEVSGNWLPIRYNNFWVALQQSLKELKSKDITLEVLENAKAKNYGNEYLPSVLGFSSYSTLMDNYERS